MISSFSDQDSSLIMASGSSFQASTARERANAASFEGVEECFREAMWEPLSQAEEIGEADIVVGIPFYNEVDTIGPVLKTVAKGLEEFYPNQKCVIVAAGSPAGGKALKVINTLPKSDKIKLIAFLLDDERINGRGWSVRAILEIARILGADLAIVEADLRSRTRDGAVEGLAPEWISLLLGPIKSEKMDVVISRFNRHHFESPISTHLVYPLLTAIYNRPIHDLVGGQWGISHRLLRTYLQDPRYPWSTEISGYGVDIWLATTAITNEARICEANLGIKIHKPSVAKTELVLWQVAEVLCEQIVADKEWWGGVETIRESSLLQPLATFGVKKAHQPDGVQIFPQQLVARYKRGFNKFHSLYERILPEEAYRQLKQMAGTETKLFDFPAKLWAQIVYHFLLDLAFRKEFAKGDLMNSFVPLYEGYAAGFALKIQTLKAKLGSLLPDEAEHLTSLEAKRQIEGLEDEFIRQKPDFLAAWEVREEALKPPVPGVTYREFIPGVPLVVPLELTAADGKVVATANGIYESVFDRHKKEFERFVYERLKTPGDASSQEIARRIRNFMHQVEKEIDKSLLPGDLSTVEGTREVVEAIFRHLPHQDTFALVPEMASWLLWQYPPSNLLTKLGYSNLNALLEEYEPNDVLALANWSEEREYAEQIWALIKENDRPEHFGPCALKPLVVSHEEFPSLVEMKESGALCKIAGRVVISNLHKGMGGEFPKLCYFTHIAKNIIEVERFGKVWRRFSEERKDFGEKVINSLEGHWGRDPLSAHNIFENGHQRVLVERLREMMRRLHQEGGENKAKLVALLNNVIDSYHLALTLPDGTFIPCSAWTWASYSFKGGRGLPTPLSLHVERDWSSREFLTEYFKAAGGKEEAIEEKIMELIEEGREWEDLSRILLGGIKEAEEIMPEQIVTPEHPAAGALVRFVGNPILKPIKQHHWESICVFNPGVIKLNGRVYLIYRAVGEDNISRFGLAVSDDGFKFVERSEKPIFEPKGKSEEKGCEDPRLTLIDARICMVYTAYDGLVAQIALASIGVNDFLNHRWGAWRRHGLVFPGFTDKDGTLFPERFNGRFAMLHRVDPHIWITFSPHLRCPWPRKEHRILAGSRPGMVWDGAKIGGGAQPIKTKYGWLLIYHGVDYAHVYRLGVMLLDLADPKILLYRSPNSVLEPTERHEVGEAGKCWVHNVVFSCGVAPREDNKEILDAEDEVLVYYGAADSVVSVATVKIAALIPEEFR
ncbi:MAG: glycosidase [Dehalococcoidales bacterium]|nr:glycosidase [Dehalococcoidales bacterium]